MCLYTFIEHSHTYVWTYTQSQTHSQAEIHTHRHWKSRDTQPLLWLFYPMHKTRSPSSLPVTPSLHLLSPLASLPVLSGKLFLLSIRYAPLLDILHFYPLTEKKKSFQKRALLSPCLMPGIITISTDNLGGREREAGAPQRRSTFFHPKGSPHLPYI